MSDQSYGLRFDIYERVQLSADVTGIEELIELELLPEIQVVPGDEYATLRGHLHVTGLYRGHEDTQELSHLIPVEITVPLSRVNRLEDITVEIENFDVDLLNPHSLNITGVLSLRGIETVAFVPTTEEWKNEEYTVAHEAETEVPSRDDQVHLAVNEPSANEPSYYDFNSHAAEPYRVAPELPQLRETVREEQPVRKPERPLSPLWADKEAANASATFRQEYREAKKEDNWNIFNEQDRSSSASTPHEPQVVSTEHTWEKEPPLHAEPLFEEGDVVQSADEYLEAQGIREQDIVQATEAQVEEKPELKIALNSKSEDVAQEQVPISKLLSTGRPGYDEDSQDVLLEEQQLSAKDDGEEVRWKNLFITNTQEQTPFRKVKLVIVQREETIDAIADRYQLNPRELLLYNRLSEQSLEQGQVLYIPSAL
ncbi:stage VI sporulation protein D [Paenibacillus shirakamiensis]|uniref:Stage VI sporulation protein D n=1 Tax=Paenibacillus shirakamiensis TaxID=1265935 RepID=A0ABS4JFB3_9BACL|nr:LysM peptidoglycan-binding domain-containing protein [Paenibacillus shirakamiensis]MBP2000409.1 stage VI sporulation protein D [Paenibacillus shirakamiensis]